MRGEAAAPSQVSLSQLEEKIDSLADLFRRRLLDDREKQRTFDALYEQLVATRIIAEGEIVGPLARRLFAVIDRLDAALDNSFADSIADELVEVLSMHGIEELQPLNDQFDPTTQEVGSVVKGDQTNGVLVRAVLRRGWRCNERILRPTVVSVSEQLAHAVG